MSPKISSEIVLGLLCNSFKPNFKKHEQQNENFIDTNIYSFFLCICTGKGPEKPVAGLDALTIQSTPLSTKTTDVTQAWSVLSDEELERSKGATIAETLSETPGVSQTHFGPTANRPIIRGMDKFRVRMLQNGTDTFDVSAQSEDHAVQLIL